MYGNGGNEYIIDTDTQIDSDLDAIADNDKDNKETSSYTEGSVFSIGNLSDVKTRKKEIKITIIGDDGKIINTKLLQVILDYIPDTSSEEIKEITGT
jgi:hypothetical protein